MKKLLFACCSLLLLACKTDVPGAEALQSQLAGRWELAEASRNGKPTESLDGTFFEFTDTELRSNLSGAASTAPYTLDGQVIESADPRLTTDYSIAAISADTLILRTEMRNVPFEFLLLRAAPPE